MLDDGTISKSFDRKDDFHKCPTSLFLNNIFSIYLNFKKHLADLQIYVSPSLLE